jgi:hypothetical protein
LGDSLTAAGTTPASVGRPGVRRGMREFYAGQLDVARQIDGIRRGPRDW